MVYMRPTLNRALIEALERVTDDMAPTERCPDLTKAWATAMNFLPEVPLANALYSDKD